MKILEEVKLTSGVFFKWWEGSLADNIYLPLTNVSLSIVGY